MKHSAEERARLRAQVRAMSLPEKLEYIFTYFKLPIALGVLAIVLVCNVAGRLLFPVKPVLYVGVVNVAIGDDCEAALTEEYVARIAGDPKRSPVSLYKNLYLSADPAAQDHEYAYASRMKLMAAVNAKELDVVLMNREGYDLLSADGYLMELPRDFSPMLVENAVVLENNELDCLLDTAQEPVYITRSAANAIDLSDTPFCDRFGFSGAVYAGILANTPRTDTAMDYLAFLCSGCQ